MPRFADTSMLMSTEPIFGDTTLDDDDWLEPPTPGPSRLLPPKSVKRARQLDPPTILPISEEDERAERYDVEEESYDRAGGGGTFRTGTAGGYRRDDKL